MGPHWLLRMSRWARKPPSWGSVKLVVAVVLICAILFAVERWVGWPDALSVEPRNWRRP